jgi:hypothetical protein
MTAFWPAGDYWPISSIYLCLVESLAALEREKGRFRGPFEGYYPNLKNNQDWLVAKTGFELRSQLDVSQSALRVATSISKHLGPGNRPFIGTFYPFFASIRLPAALDLARPVRIVRDGAASRNSNSCRILDGETRRTPPLLRDGLRDGPVSRNRAGFVTSVRHVRFGVADLTGRRNTS